MDSNNAPAQRLPPSPKYEIDWQGLEYIDKVDENLLCGICKTPFYEPVTTLTCKHTFCRSCLEQHVLLSREEGLDPLCPYCRDELKGKRCPSCQIIDEEDEDETYDTADRIILNMVNELQVKCPEDCCNWKNSRRSLEKHVKTCLFVSVPCVDPACSKSIKRTLQKERCLHYEVECDLCHTVIEMAQMREHRSAACPKRRVRCDICTHYVQYDQLSHHKELCHPEELCSQKDVARQFQRAGCDYVDFGGKIAEHEETCSVGRGVRTHSRSTQTLQDELQPVKDELNEERSQVAAHGSHLQLPESQMNELVVLEQQSPADSGSRSPSSWTNNRVTRVFTEPIRLMAAWPLFVNYRLRLVLCCAVCFVCGIIFGSWWLRPSQ